MNNNKKGFTLLEILLVVAAIAILAGIVIVAINPAKQLADTRNAQRRVDVATILNAVYQYYIDAGSLPTDLDAAAADTTFEICAANVATSTCGALISLNELIYSEKYIVDIPSDPNGTCATNGVCYTISKSSNNRITITAPNQEQGATISVTR